MAKITLAVTVDLEENLTDRELTDLAADIAFDLKSVARFSKHLHARQGLKVTARTVPSATWGSSISPLSA